MPERVERFKSTYRFLLLGYEVPQVDLFTLGFGRFLYWLCFLLISM